MPLMVPSLTALKMYFESLTPVYFRAVGPCARGLVFAKVEAGDDHRAGVGAQVVRPVVTVNLYGRQVGVVDRRSVAARHLVGVHFEGNGRAFGCVDFLVA